MTGPCYMKRWGKAKPDGDALVRWHPLAYHLLDVSATVDAMPLVRPLAFKTGARLLGLSEDEARKLVFPARRVGPLHHSSQAIQLQACA